MDINEFKKYVGPDVLPCPDPIVEREILNTIIEFCDKTHLLTREFVITLSNYTINTTLQNSIDVDLGNFFDNSVQAVAVMDFNLDGTAKYPKRKQLLNTIPAAVWSQIKEGSTIYFDFPDKTTLRIFDRSSTETYIYVKIAVKPTRTAGQVDDVIFDEWLDEIVAGVKYRILSMPNKEWSDAKGAAESFLNWKRGISRARMKMRKSYTDEPLEVTPKSFGDVDYDRAGDYFYWDV